MLFGGWCSFAKNTTPRAQILVLNIGDNYQFGLGL